MRETDSHETYTCIGIQVATAARQVAAESYYLGHPTGEPADPAKDSLVPSGERPLELRVGWNRPSANSTRSDGYGAHTHVRDHACVIQARDLRRTRQEAAGVG